MVRRALLVWFFAVWPALSSAQDKPQQPPPKPAEKQEMPPEEDTSTARTQYSFNPLQAEMDVKVGNDYFKRGKYRPAEMRFRSATKWNEDYAEAWLRLGEAQEKLNDSKGAKESYTKYLQLSPNAKNAADIRKRMEKLK